MSSEAAQMVKQTVHIEVSPSTMETWQSIVALSVEIVEIPAALIMKVAEPKIEVLVASDNQGNPYHPGDAETLENSGLYCETVINRKSRASYSMNS
jgi:hypothetical protein